MNFILQPWQLLHLILAGWVNEPQQQVIEYLRTENQVLREKLGKRRILLDDEQRRSLAVKGKILGRKLLGQVGTLFTPDTILRWHRLLVARKWDDSDRRQKKPGRLALSQEIRDLVVRFAQENPSWGYDRIQGALANVGHEISDTSVANILKNMASSRRLNGGAKPPGRPFFRLTGRYWRPSTLRRSRFGRRMDRSRSISSLSWSWRPAAFITIRDEHYEFVGTKKKNSSCNGI
jgi:hypothetical protein